jgi:hypothetical protein
MTFKERQAPVSSSEPAKGRPSPERVIDINDGIRELLELQGAKDVDALRAAVAACCLQACDCCLQIN